MKWLVIFFGALLLLVGTVWVLQGLNILTQGFMAGHIQYAILGAVVDIAGIALIVVAGRRGRPTHSSPTSTLKR